MTRAPISAVRLVTTPSKGATIWANPFIARSWSRWAWAALAAPVLLARSSSFSSASCLETASSGNRLSQRSAVVAESFSAVGGAQIGAGLADLLVQFRRVDGRQKIALFHMGADILVPGMHIAGHAGIKLGVVIGLKRAGQHQRLALAAGDRARSAPRWEYPLRRSSS